MLAEPEQRRLEMHNVMRVIGISMVWFYHEHDPRLGGGTGDVSSRDKGGKRKKVDI